MSVKHNTNTEKLRKLHIACPDEIPAVLIHMQSSYQYLVKHQDEYRNSPEWKDFNFDWWFALAKETDQLITDERPTLIRNAKFFSYRLTFTAMLFYVNDCIIKYAEFHSKNPVFKEKVKELFTSYTG